MPDNGNPKLPSEICERIANSSYRVADWDKPPLHDVRSLKYFNGQATTHAQKPNPQGPSPSGQPALNPSAGLSRAVPSNKDKAKSSSTHGPCPQIPSGASSSAGISQKKMSRGRSPSRTSPHKYIQQRTTVDMSTEDRSANPRSGRGSVARGLASGQGPSGQPQTRPQVQRPRKVE